MKTSPHRNTSAIVDLKAIRNNIEKFKKHIHPNAEIWPAVKADAYGHGSVEVSKAVSDLVGGFCVSNLDEAIELRNTFFLIDNVIIFASRKRNVIRPINVRCFIM